MRAHVPPPCLLLTQEGIWRLLPQTLFLAIESTPSHASWFGLIFKHENLLPVRFSGACGYSRRSCVPAAHSWRCSFFLRTIRLLVPLQSEALVERFAAQLKEDLELVTSFAQNTQSYHHLRRTCLGLRVTPGSLGSREWLKVGLFEQFSP